VRRRDFLRSGAALATAARGAPAAAKQLESAELSLSELTLRGDPAFGRALLAVPRQLPENPELLVLLHGLGETTDQTMGARAFAERYGLLTAVARLTHPPLARSDEQHDYFGPGRLSELNQRLAARPFRCPVVLCPFTPNTYKPGGDEVLVRFAKFVTGPLLAEAEARAGVAFPVARCMISGVSLGGYLAIEVFLRRPDVFCALGTAQGAFGPQQAARYAVGVAAATERVGPRRVEILTTSFDPYRRPNELFHQHLGQKKQASRLRVAPGPHDQRWLNESGVIEMLLCADDVFAAGRAEAS
jgi:pimeloyl-ACP methyl ester carboxylesterase